jgi:predicted porin
MPEASRYSGLGPARENSVGRFLGRAACLSAMLVWTSLSHAQDFSATIYGNLIAYLELVSSYRATVDVPANKPSFVPATAYTGINEKHEIKLNSSTSNFGLRGTERIDAGMSVWFQVESLVLLDTGGSTLASRNTALALQAPQGTVVVGLWDTPYKYVSLFSGTLRGLFPWDAVLMNNPGFGVPVTITQGTRVNAVPDASFNRRQGNTVQYWSPLIDGFAGRLMYGVPENKTGATGASPAVASALYSGSLAYATDIFALFYAYEQHRDYFGLAQIGGSAGATLRNPGSRDEGHELLGIYSIGDWKFIGQLERLRYASDDTLGGAVNRYQRDAFWINVSKWFGPAQAWIAGGSTFSERCRLVGGGACSANGLGGKELAIGWAYDFSRRTQVFAAAYLIRNGESQSYAGNIFPMAAGAATRGASAGIMHRF